MLLRSSSTPVLGSLISSIAADSPNNYHHYETTTSPFRHHYPSFHGHNHHNSLSFHPSPGSLHLSTVVSCGSSPVSPSVHDFEIKGFRRAQSDGNLEGLARAACDGSSTEEFYNQQQHQHMKLSAARNKRLMLETIPSFSVYHSRATCEEEEYESDFDEEEEEEKENSKVMAISGSTTSHRFNSINTENMLLINNEGGLVGVSQEMFLSKGLETAIDGNGIGGGGWGSGGGGEFNSTGSSGAGDGGGGDNHDVEEYYKKMVEENPGNPLFLGNYAQFLYQSKGDLKGAEEYYSRAILADPKDGETLSQYAKLVWELHRDEERASSYFERAVQASPQDSRVHAAYASFLWETEDDGDECSAPVDIDSTIASQFHHGTLASA